MNNGRYEPLSIPRRIILGPGPSSAHPRVLQAMSSPMIGYLDPAYFRILEELRTMLGEVWQTQQMAFAVAGSGSAGMEAGLVSLAEPGDTVIVCSYGFFCERMLAMCRRMGLNAVPVQSEWGRAMDPRLLDSALKANPGTRLVAAIHAETSTGVLQPLQPLAALAHDHGALFMADCVTSLGGCEVKFDGWELDYAYSGTQKCLAAPPGVSPVALSDRALKAIKSRKRPPLSWYLDLSLMADYWGKEHRAHHTSPVSMIYGLREALALALNEGLAARWTRHARNAEALRAGLIALRLDLPVPASARLDQLTVINIPAGIDDARFRSQLLEDYSIEIGRGQGVSQGKVWRVGLMGESCIPANVLALLAAFERLLPIHGFEVTGGAGVAAASTIFSRYATPAN